MATCGRCLFFMGRYDVTFPHYLATMENGQVCMFFSKESVPRGLRYRGWATLCISCSAAASREMRRLNQLNGFSE